MVQSQTPTHKITHRSGREVGIYIPTNLQLQLKAINDAERRRAQDWVCMRFKEAYAQKYQGYTLRWVEWSDIQLEVIPWNSPTPSYLTGDTSSPVDPDGESCDECPECDKGYHERCRGICPNVSRW